MTFELHPNLQSKTWLVDLLLCKVLLEDEKNYPWIFLVPRRPNVSRIMDLCDLDQLQLTKELDLAQKVLWEEFRPDQLNVAAIGNKTAQLHIHVIARSVEDPSWPNTVWDHPVRCRYDDVAKHSVTKRLMQKFEELCLLKS